MTEPTLVEGTRPAPRPAMSRVEFVAMMAMLTAMVALAIDGMMPALPLIAQELSPEAPNTAQFVITGFVLGLGVGTLFTGPLSDRFGRKPVIVVGTALYILAALAATQVQSIEMLLVARVIQGVGCAGPRVVVMAVIRDLYAGRGMAQISSFIMMVFALVPALAPMLGAQVQRMFDWHAIFYTFAVFGAVAAGWFALRQPETLPHDARRPFRFSAFRAAIRELMSLRDVRLPVLVMSLNFGCLFSTIASIQPIYDQWLGRGDSFPMWFGLTAILAASAGYINARIVVRLGMRRLVTAMLLVQIVVSAGVGLYTLSDPAPLGRFLSFLFWQQMIFFQAGMTLGNLNAMAMEPVGHIAGTAASVISAVATVTSVILTVPILLAFDGTPRPLMLGVFLFASLGLWIMIRLGPGEAD